MSLRIAALVLFSIAVVFGLVGSFVPLGESWIEPAGPDVRTTESYGMWGKSVDIDAATGTSSDGVGWFDDANDGSAGITYLRAAPVLLTLGLVLGVGAVLVLALRGSVAAGVLGAIGLVTVLGALVLNLAGMSLQSAALTGEADALGLAAGAPLLVLCLLLYLVAALMSMRAGRIAHAHHDHDHDHDHGHDHGHGHGHAHHHGYERSHVADAVSDDSWDDPAPRRVRCPDCGSVATTMPGAATTCGACGFSSSRVAAF